MFSLVGRRGLNRFGVKRLESSLPLVMHVLDVGRGLAPGTRKHKVVNMDQIQCPPMRSLWSGLSAPDVQWDPSIVHYDWNAYYKSSANFTNVEKSTQFSSYAILADDYVHAMLRFGYHFAVVDAVVCDTLEHNYVHFSFKGGGGQDVQRLHRLRIITTILENFHFRFRLTADMLEAWFDRREREESFQNLKILGFVLGKTVLLDMRIDSEEKVDTLASEILDQIYDFLPVQTPTG
jgi:pyruvate,water dikinase